MKLGPVPENIIYFLKTPSLCAGQCSFGEGLVCATNDSAEIALSKENADNAVTGREWR